jgi:hypothetical protein
MFERLALLADRRATLDGHARIQVRAEVWPWLSASTNS